MGKLICCIVRLNRRTIGKERFETKTVYRFHYYSKDIS